ncbi:MULTISPECIES: SEC-C metal-binding domain-containing protein [Bacillus cereus group]|uniref:SEC-C metal-binding domain-containing protein n=1 Tax=Bacillus TaxID=1386 RepID=UPI0001A1C7E7|nr:MULTISPECIES: SEC-C metal-binding domain-containing protein [Bacillus cereus group]EEM68353.1 DNA binding protein [Bacillus thuringiensis serovar andalousiensis BGSC 4AW1]MEB9631790.1 SEC-C metal-binding domain-containing protein [Bacillus anthracis]
MYPLGSENHPIMIKVRTRAQAEKIATICDEYDFYYIISLELNEDLTDLKKAIKGHTHPMDIYDTCACNSGKKYKFCCMNKEIELDI